MEFYHQSGFYTAQVSASTATRLTISEVIAEEQTYNVDLDGNGTIGDDIERYLFSANQPARTNASWKLCDKLW